MTGRMSARAAACLILLALPTPAAAQFGAIEAFARNVTDVSFYGGLVRMAPSSDHLRERGSGMPAYGVEMLFEIGAVSRPVGDLPLVRDTVRMELVRVEVHSGGGRADTVRFYEPRQPAAPVRPTERIWTFEMGFGYGQVTGFDVAAGDLDMRGAIRDLPSVSVYANHEATGIFAGLRSGFMKTQGLQVVDVAEGTSVDGSAESFLVGTVLGYAIDMGGAAFFLESAYSMRYFPSVQWAGDAALRARVPRDLRLSGVSLSAGIQIALRNQ
jgi:hypothetical protein